MTSIIDLPREIINKILVGYLDKEDIKNCHYASNYFHVLSEFQKNIIGGWDYCIIMGKIDESKYLYEKNNGLFSITRSIQIACSNGHLELLKWLYSLTQYIHEAYSIYIFLNCACFNNYLDVAKWLHTVHRFYDAKKNTYLFEDCCKRGLLNIAQWIYEKLSLNNYNFKDLFEICCKKESLDIVKWLWSISKFDNEFIQRLLIYHCRYGTINIAKFLYGLQENAIIMKRLFISSCM
jgi:hypothetical protein